MRTIQIAIVAIPAVLCLAQPAAEAQESPVNAASSRMQRLYRLQDVNWADPLVEGIVRAIEYETGRLLETQNRSGNDPYNGSYRQPRSDEGQPTSARWQSACDVTRKGIRALCHAFWCKPCRFYQSPRVVDSVERALAFLDRKPTVPESGAVFDIPRPYQHRTSDALQWLIMLGDRMEVRPRARLKEHLRRLLSKQDIDIPVLTNTFLAGLVLDDGRLVRESVEGLRRGLTDFERDRTPFTAKDGSVDLIQAAETVYAIGLYRYLCEGTGFSPELDKVSRLQRACTQLMEWMSFRGQPDLLATSSAASETSEIQARFMLGAVLSLSLGKSPESEDMISMYSELAPLALAQSPPRMGKLGPQHFAYLRFCPLLARLPDQIARPYPEASTRFFSTARYLTVQRPTFYVGLRLPSARPAKTTFSRATGCMNVLPQTIGCSEVYSLAEFSYMLPGTIWSDNILRKGAICLPSDLAETKCVDAAVLNNSYALAGMQLQVSYGDELLRANRSWHFFDEKFVAAASGIKAKSLHSRNEVWASDYTDHRTSLVLVFPKQIEFDYVRLFFRVHRGELHCVPLAIQFLTSSDGTRWSLLRQVREKLPRSGDTPGGFLGLKLQRTKTRLLRLNFPLGSDGPNVQIAELEVYKIDAKNDDEELPSDAVNLARSARAVASSSLSKNMPPEKVNDGFFWPTVYEANASSCLALMRVSKSDVLVGDSKGTKTTRIPLVRGKIEAKDATWLYHSGVGYYFLKPADVAIRNINGRVAGVFLDHTRHDSFAVLCYPGIDAEQAARASEAALVHVVNMNEQCHIFSEPFAGVTSAAFFGHYDEGDIASNGPVYAISSIAGDRLEAAKSMRGAPADLLLRGVNVSEAVLNGKAVEPRLRDKVLVLSTLK